MRLFQMLDPTLGDGTNVAAALEASPAFRRVTISLLKWTTIGALSTLLITQNIFFTALLLSAATQIALGWAGDAYLRLPSYDTNMYLRRYFAWRRKDSLNGLFEDIAIFFLLMLLLSTLMNLGA